MRFSDLLGRGDDEFTSRRGRVGARKLAPTLEDADELVPEEPLEPSDEWLRELGALAAMDADEIEPGPELPDAASGEPPPADAEPVADAEPALAHEPVPADQPAPRRTVTFEPIDDDLLPRGRGRRG